jgi:hypothetical protein
MSRLKKDWNFSRREIESWIISIWQTYRDISLIGEGEILEQIEELQQENAEGVNLIFLSARRP